MLQRSLISCLILLGGATLASASGPGRWILPGCPPGGFNPYAGCYPSYGYGRYPNYYGYGSYGYGFGTSFGVGYPFGGVGYYPPIGYNYYPPIAPYAQLNPVNQQAPTNGVNPPPSPYPQPYVRATPPAGEQMPTPRTDVAEIVVNVPDDAEVWIEGVKMKQTGPRRRFVSPTLVPGVSYTYEIRATWMQDGRKVSDSNQVTVHGGDRSSLTFIARPKRPDTAVSKADK